MISVTPDSILHKTKPKLHPHIGFSFSIVSCLNSSGSGFDAKPRVHSSSAFFEHKQRFKCGVETTKEHKLQFSFKICSIEVQTLFCVNCNVNGRNELFHLFEHFGQEGRLLKKGSHRNSAGSLLLWDSSGDCSFFLSTKDWKFTVL